MRAHGRATDWLRSNRSQEPFGIPGGLLLCARATIALVKFQSEAVGIKREDSRAAAYLSIPFQRWATAKVRLDDSRLLALHQRKGSILSGTDREPAMSTKAP